ncbi:Uncharacterized protein TPAR_07362 [Tolypocladium paradoxum]|uniref:Uncharacterized protein n=1 Tax=Tolypocladium paradoxum TaxID=94208 RepID=A0A2S4KQG7_9HYPO|nr:Uncharacterized protein TPAR_07362 [Tolypocladium paradoxum]
MNNSQRARAHQQAAYSCRSAIEYLELAAIATSYPLRGIWFVLRNRELWRLFGTKLLPSFVTTLCIYPTLFHYAFLPQYNFLAETLHHGQSSWLSAVTLTLGEGLVIVRLLRGAYEIDECRADMIDVRIIYNSILLFANAPKQATLLKYSLGDIVSSCRTIDGNAQDVVSALSMRKQPIPTQPWSLFQIIELFGFVPWANISFVQYLGLQVGVFLPLILIPYIGVPLFIVITGVRFSRFLHSRWFQLRGLSESEETREFSSLEWMDTWFGTVAFTLELVPVLSFLFLMTNAAASALWSAEVEPRKRRAR